MKSYTLSKSSAKGIADEIAKAWPTPPRLDKGDQVRFVEIDDRRSLLLFSSFTAIKFDNEILPFLRDEEVLQAFPSIEVDSGAVEYICNGANVMRPGVTRWGSPFKKDDIVAVQEDKHKKFISVGIALINQGDAERMVRGAVVKNAHYVGDRFWEAWKQIRV